MLIKKLKNGVTIIAIQKPNIQLSVLNILVKAGSINETESKTGVAHLTEHMMFEGSKNYPDYDEYLDALMGENNAYTCQDYTNYYISVPYKNLCKAIDLEVDRFENPTLNLKKFNSQKKVVIEEFYETSIDPPLADFWHLLLKMVNNNNNYSWPVIGENVENVKKININDVQDFFTNYYSPNRLFITVVADIEEAEIINSLKKFETITDKRNNEININIKKPILKENIINIQKRDNINNTTFFISYNIADYGSKEYFISDVISDLLTNGDSSLLYNYFVTQENICSDITSYITDNIQNNLLIIEGKLNNDITYQEFYKKYENLIHKITQNIDKKTLDKLKIKAKTYFLYTNYNSLHIAQNSSFWNALTPKLTSEYILEIYENLTLEEIIKSLNKLIIKPKNYQLVYLHSLNKLHEK